MTFKKIPSWAVVLLLLIIIVALAFKRQEYRELLRRSAGGIAAKLAALDVEKISLFGSYTRGRADMFTDLDVLVIMMTGYIQLGIELMPATTSAYC